MNNFALLILINYASISLMYIINNTQYSTIFHSELQVVQLGSVSSNWFRQQQAQISAGNFQDVETRAGGRGVGLSIHRVSSTSVVSNRRAARVVTARGGKRRLRLRLRVLCHTHTSLSAAQAAHGTHPSLNCRVSSDGFRMCQLQ